MGCTASKYSRTYNTFTRKDFFVLKRSTAEFVCKTKGITDIHKLEHTYYKCAKKLTKLGYYQVANSIFHSITINSPSLIAGYAARNEILKFYKTADSILTRSWWNRRACEFMPTSRDYEFDHRPKPTKK